MHDTLLIDKFAMQSQTTDGSAVATCLDSVLAILRPYPTLEG